MSVWQRQGFRNASLSWLGGGGSAAVNFGAGVTEGNQKGEETGGPTEGWTCLNPNPHAEGMIGVLPVLYP